MKHPKIDKLLNNLKKFDKKDRSSFSYWFNHALAFNLVAIKLGVWKPKYVFHDFEKPWLRLFWSYEKVQAFHRKHARHHLQYAGDDFDWEAMVIDWECSRYTKNAAPLTAEETLDMEVSKAEPGINKLQKSWLIMHINPVLDKFFGTLR